jgi:hypothetical protein
MLRRTFMPSRRRGGRQELRPPRRRSPKSAGTDIDEKCYVCGQLIAPAATVRLFHELMVHETCYLRHLRP